MLSQVFNAPVQGVGVRNSHASGFGLFCLRPNYLPNMGLTYHKWARYA